METPLFFVGQKVQLINDDFTVLLAQDPRIVVPVKDVTYTIRANFQLLHAVGVTLAEISNTHAIPKGRKLEVNWNQRRFRAVQELPATVLEEEVSYADAV